MARYKIKRYGTRAEVMHGKARMTEGRLTKNDLTYNPQGAIVSKKKSKLMKTDENPLRKIGLFVQQKRSDILKDGIKEWNYCTENELNEFMSTKQFQYWKS